MIGVPTAPQTALWLGSGAPAMQWSVVRGGKTAPVVSPDRFRVVGVVVFPV